MSTGTRPADPTVTAAPPPGGLDPGWTDALAGVLADLSRHRLVFQPVVDLQRGTVAGYEALSRFAGPPDAGPTSGSRPRAGSGSAPSWTPGRFAGQLDAWVLAEGVERTAELESLIRLRVPLGDALAAAARRFEADHGLDVVVVLDDWSRPVALVDRGHYLGVLRIEQLVHRLLAGPRP